MHLDSAGEAAKPKEVLCPVDGTPFVPTRSWQKWCSTNCRNTYHQSMKPEALRRDLDAARRALAELKAEHDALKRRLDVLDDPVAHAPA